MVIVKYLEKNLKANTVVKSGSFQKEEHAAGVSHLPPALGLHDSIVGIELQSLTCLPDYMSRIFEFSRKDVVAMSQVNAVLSHG
jgi:hypothetical protein